MHYRAIMHVALAILGICTALSQSAVAQTRLGLYVTQEEVAIWRQRAQNGPYKTAGDASTNSPGDWDRIVANKNTFAANPSSGRWIAPPLTNGCVNPSNPTANNWPETPGNQNVWSFRLRDAAFYDLVMGVTTNRAALKAELLWVSSQSFTQFGNPSGIWCFNVIWDNNVAFWGSSVLTRVLFAYEYVGRAAFTQGELDQLDRWFFDAGDFWRRDMNEGLNGVFVNRPAGDYTPTQACTNAVEAYLGGPMIQSYAQHYNNRRTSMIRFATLAGIMVQQAGRNYTNGRYGTQAQMVQSGKTYVQEYLRFSLFPQGIVGEFERRVSGGANVDIGWAYGGVVLGEIVEIAEAFARTGDVSLYTYSTALGLCNTAGTINDGGSRNGQNRDLLFAVQSYMKYHTDQYARYWPNASTEDNRIDGRHPRSGATWSGIYETNLVPGNVYFQDAFIKQAYTRTHANAVPYPSNPQNGPTPWQGENAVFPGVLFMFGGMEGKVWPYPGSNLSPNVPENLRVISILP